MKTLIVEDDFTSRLIIQKFMEPYGECHQAVSGKEAMQAYKLACEENKPYDLICLDIMIPELDGQQVLQSIRRIEAESGVPLGQGVKIIMITALGDKDNVLDAFRETCDAYLVKPVERSKLLGLLHTFKFLK